MGQGFRTCSCSKCGSTNPKCSRGSHLNCSCSSQLAFCPHKTWDPNKTQSWLAPQLGGVCSCWWPTWDLSAWNQPWPVYSSADKLSKLHVFGGILRVCSARWARPWTGKWGLDQISSEFDRSPLYTGWSQVLVCFKICVRSVCPAVGTVCNASWKWKMWAFGLLYDSRSVNQLIN